MESQGADPKKTPASYADFSDAEEQGGWLKTAVQFFAIPMLIVILAVGVYLGVRYLWGGGPKTAAEFVEVLSRQELRQRTWERGSGETLACGTGASAVCVAGVLTGRSDRRVTVHLLGGDLELEWNEADNHVYKTGPAVEVFSGDWPW